MIRSLTLTLYVGDLAGKHDEPATVFYNENGAIVSVHVHAWNMTILRERLSDKAIRTIESRMEEERIDRAMIDARNEAIADRQLETERQEWSA